MIEVCTGKITKDVIDVWMSSWEDLSTQLHAAHSDRNKEQTLTLMLQGIEAYEQLLFESALSEATLEDDFELYPINGKERLQFIKARPAQFASYRQLDELYKETKKRTARLRLKK